MASKQAPVWCNAYLAISSRSFRVPVVCWLLLLNLPGWLFGSCLDGGKVLEPRVNWVAIASAEGWCSWCETHDVHNVTQAFPWVLVQYQS